MLAAQNEPPVSADRPLPLVARADLQVTQVLLRGESSWTVKDPISLDYFQLGAEQHALLQLLDGTRTVDELRRELMQQIPTCRPTADEVRRLAFDLYDKGIAYSTRAGQGESLRDRGRKRKRKQLAAALLNLLYIRLPGFHPRRLLNAIYPIARPLMSPAAIALGMMLVVGAWISLLVNSEAVVQQLPDVDRFSTPQMLLVLWATLGLAKLMHELGHALACKRVGGECQEIGVALLVLSPCLYCDVSDAALFPQRWKRLAVGAAGLYVELLLSALAVIVWWHIEPGVMRNACLCLFLVTNVSAIAFNLNPLLRLDGYYLMSDWLETPNLRRRADKALGKTAAKRLLGVDLPAADPREDQRWWLMAYAIASACYRWTFLALVTLSLYAMLRPFGLGAVGLLIGALVAIVTLVQSALRFRRFIIAHGERLRESMRARLTAALAMVGMGAFFLAPVPWSVEAQLVVQPAQVRHVYVSTPGRLERIQVGESEIVKAGQVLAVLENPDKRDRYHELRAAARSQQVEVALHQARGDAAAHAVAMSELQGFQDHARDAHQQLEKLSITAPCNGRLIEPPQIDSPRSEANSVTLADWSGSPLDDANLGAHLQRGVHVASIAPNDAWQAVLMIDQTTRHEFPPGADVRLQLDAQPHRALRGKITHVSRWVENPATPDSESASTKNQRAQYDHRYQAHIAIDTAPLPLVAGMTGRARVRVTHRTAAGWVWRTLRLTFNNPL